MKKLIAAAILPILAISACTASALPVETQTPQPPQPTAESSPSPTLEIQAQKLLELPSPDPQLVRVDIAAKPCSISWSNSGEYLPCPGIFGRRFRRLH